MRTSGLAVVTGASTGIGRATAEHLAQAGFQVLAGVRTDAAAEAVEVVLVEPGAIATPIWEKGLATARGLTETMTADQRQRYRQITAAASRRAQQAARDGVPPEQVAQVITEAVTARRPGPASWSAATPGSPPGLLRCCPTG